MNSENLKPSFEVGDKVYHISHESDEDGTNDFFVDSAKITKIVEGKYYLHGGAFIRDEKDIWKTEEGAENALVKLLNF